ncbi:proteophosphoglycan ppg4 [Rhodotorula toruloides]|uniref:Proteophosphoglycan ppg4 n=1 Tax=Rhodotorula toruloides TaxID=5286 RepID=A0A511KF46_RHOTO|nr:proteophosphoglycan ppg4 [Rhodotorula toruloides]
MLLPRLAVALSYCVLALAIPFEKRQAASSSSSSSSSSSPSVASSSSAAAASSGGASTSVPFYSAPNTFTPTATGETAAPGSVITMINSAGAGSYTDTFVYTAAATTVPPTGNVTNPAVPAASGGAGGVTDLQPNPTNLQIAAAPPRLSTTSLAATLGVAAAIALATTIGAGNVLA